MLCTRTEREPVELVCSAARADPQFQDTMVIVRQQLAAKGAGPEVQAYVEQLMLERHETYKMYATAEADKRRHLLDHVSRLEVCAMLPIVSIYHRDRQSSLDACLPANWHGGDPSEPKEVNKFRAMRSIL